MAKKTAAKEAQDWSQVRELIAKIEDACAACEGGEAIFRGEPEENKSEENKPEENKLPAASRIYCEHENKKLFGDHFNPIDIEREIVQNARATQFPADTLVAEILTDLRHFGAPTSLVDFTRDLLVALFFACYGEQQGEDGYVFVLPTKGLKVLKSDEEIHGEERGLDPALITPARTQWSRARVEAQKSVFVHAPKGFVEQSKLIKILVRQDLKQACLKYLRRHHNIRQQAIFNDLIGFVQNEENFESAADWFYRGLANAKQERYQEAICDYDKALDLRPEYPEAFNNRGVAKTVLDQFDEAVEDYDAALRQRPNYPEALNNRGVVYTKPGKPDKLAKAVEDFDEALRWSPKNPEALFNCSVAKGLLGKIEEAAAGLKQAAELAIQQDKKDFARKIEALLPRRGDSDAKTQNNGLGLMLIYSAGHKRHLPPASALPRAFGAQGPSENSTA